MCEFEVNDFIHPGLKSLFSCGLPVKQVESGSAHGQ